MTKDKIWLISAIVCFLASVASLAGSAIGMSDTLARMFGVVNIISLVIVVYKTVQNNKVRNMRRESGESARSAHP